MKCLRNRGSQRLSPVALRSSSLISNQVLAKSPAERLKSMGTIDNSGSQMYRYLSIVLAALVWTFTLSTAFGFHPDRPENVPEPNPSLRVFYVDGNGTIITSEGGGTISTSTYMVFGWTFDPSDENSPWVASSPTIQVHDQRIFTSVLGAFNSSVLELENVNQASAGFPIFSDGPRQIHLYDNSSLLVNNSIIDTVFHRGTGRAEITNTRFAGDLLMFGDGTMNLTEVEPFNIDQGLDGHLNSLGGTTNVNSSTLKSVQAAFGGQVFIGSSVVRSGIHVTESNASSVTLTDSSVGSLSASEGSITMSGGSVEGLVQAFNTGAITASSSSIAASVSALDSGTVSLSGSSVTGGLSVGGIVTNGSGNASRISVSGGSISENAVAINNGELVLTDVRSGPGVGDAIHSSDNSKVTVTGGSTEIFGSVTATEDSSLRIESALKVYGRVEAYGNAVVDLVNVGGNSGVAVVAPETGTATIRMTGGDTFNAFVLNGNMNLKFVSVSDVITVHGKGHLTFGPGSSTGTDIINFGNELGLVSVTGGTVAGNLVGFGDSITAMSGGHVEGLPQFFGRATFLYSGGTFGLSSPPPEVNAMSFFDEVAEVMGGEGEEEAPPVLAPLEGFVASEATTIKFIGSGLQSSLIDPDFMYGDFSYSVYQLTGRLADGSSMDGGLVYLQNSSEARFELVEVQVPEPKAIFYLVVFALLLPGFWYKYGRNGICRKFLCAD